MNPAGTGAPAGVGYMLATAQILGAVAWPVVVLIVLWSFRRPIRNALQGLIGLRFGSTTVKFDRASGDVALSVVESVTERRATASVQADHSEQTRPELRSLYESLARENPAPAILKGYAAVEWWIAENLPAHGVSSRASDRQRSALEITEDAVDQGILPKSSLQQLKGLAVMRNLVADRPNADVTLENAQEFLTLADAVIYTFGFALESDRS